MKQNRERSGNRMRFLHFTGDAPCVTPYPLWPERKVIWRQGVRGVAQSTARSLGGKLKSLRQIILKTDGLEGVGADV